MRCNAAGRIRAQLALLALPVLLVACEPGAPPPGPVDLVKKIFNPSYDYTRSPSTWDDDDRHSRSHHGERWSSPCAERDLACTHEGTTICCSHDDRCCAGRTGPFCCSDRSSAYDDASPRYDDERSGIYESPPIDERSGRYEDDRSGRYDGEE
jgi:hypothetical protein